MGESDGELDGESDGESGFETNLGLKRTIRKAKDLKRATLSSKLKCYDECSSYFRYETE